MVLIQGLQEHSFIYQLGVADLYSFVQLRPCYTQITSPCLLLLRFSWPNSTTRLKVLIYWIVCVLAFKSHNLQVDARPDSSCCLLSSHLVSSFHAIVERPPCPHSSFEFRHLFRRLVTSLKAKHLISRQCRLHTAVRSRDPLN